MGCLDETTIARLLDRNLSPDESGLVIHHIDGCEECRRVVSALARGQAHDEGAPIAAELAIASLELTSFARGFAPVAGPAHALDLAPADDEPLPLQLGRYTLLRRLGRGAMGEVYAGQDPELGREVAIKVLQLTTGSANARERMLREAKALAKVSHPNVVAVYDVGAAHDQVFIAMELVRGGTLRDWLAQPRSRAIEEIVRVMADVARGLAAAHACGLVHRDVKPDNILFSPDGRARIGDFGLALPLGDASIDGRDLGPAGSAGEGRRGSIDGRDLGPAGSAGEGRRGSIDGRDLGPAGSAGEGRRGSIDGRDHGPAGSAGNPADVVRTLTQTGTMVGTPAYMAPEQFTDGTADARSDQFAFCVTLYEAIYGVRPFSGDTVAALADVVRTNARQPVPARRVPRWLRAVLDRGLAIEPAARFPSMEALVAALTAGVRRRRTIAAGVLLAAGASVGLVATLALHANAAGPEPCTGLDHEIASAWNPQLRSTLAAGLRATGKPFAADSADRVTAILDRYAAAWTTKAHDVCTATRIRGDQSEATMDLRRGCLDAQRDDLAAVVKTLTAADAATVVKAIDAASALPSLSRCDDVEALRRQRPPSMTPVMAARLGALGLELATERALVISGRRAQALPIAERIVDETRELDAPNVRTLALTRLAQALAPLGRLERGRALLQEAIATADRAGLDELRAEAWIELITILSARGEDLPLAGQLLPQASAAVERLGAHLDPQSAVEWLVAQGALLVQTGNPNAAADKFRLAQTRAGAAFGEDSLTSAQVAANLVRIEKLLHSPQARSDAQRLVERLVKLYGEHHPETADARMVLSESLLAVGDGEGAAAALRVAIADLVSAYGDDDPLVADARSRLAGALLMTHHLVEANAENDRALAIRTKLFRPDNMFVIESLGQRGRLLGAMNKHADAVVTLTDVHDRLVSAFGPDAAELGETELDLGDEYAELHAYGDAESHYRRALAIKERVLGHDNPSLADALIDIGTVLVATHREREAIAPLERALALKASEQGDPQSLADARLQLGHALAATDRKRALELARAALEQYEKDGPPESRDEAQALITRLSR